ncbi:MAG: hypothetical protein Q7T80_09120 [Methanoregula sp.]|nr:hypothetical protein [Methanoregula sp.]
MDTDKIAQAFLSAGVGTTVTCDDAFSIATRFGITKKEIREYCESPGIRIRGSQRDCFR